MRYLVVATVVWMAVGVSSAWAHCGGMAQDGCHNHKAEGTRHSHVPGTCEVEYQCGPSGAGPILPKMIEVLETDYQQLQHDLATQNQTHPTPVSYTHLTLPTICSV